MDPVCIPCHLTRGRSNLDTLFCLTLYVDWSHASGSVSGKFFLLIKKGLTSELPARHALPSRAQENALDLERSGLEHVRPCDHLIRFGSHGCTRDKTSASEAQRR